MDKNFYQVFLVCCKKSKISKFINDELEITSDQFDKEASNKEYSKTK